MLNYLLKLEPYYLLSLLGLLLFSVLLVTTIVFVRSLPVVLKNEEVVYDKPKFYTKFLGVLFIVSLSFAANNPFVYVISVIIIATLVTELQFLEMLIALIWNRPEYIKGKLETLNKQQGETESEDKLEKLEKLARDVGETLKNETIKSNQYLLVYHFERVYRLIFGSQLKVLLDAELNDGKISLKRAVLIYRASGWSEKGYDVGNYTSFLLNMKLLTYTSGKTPEDCYYTLTSIGHSFLQYLRDNRMSLYKPL